MGDKLLQQRFSTKGLMQFEKNTPTSQNIKAYLRWRRVHSTQVSVWVDQFQNRRKNITDDKVPRNLAIPRNDPHENITEMIVL